MKALLLIFPIFCFSQELFLTGGYAMHTSIEHGDTMSYETGFLFAPKKIGVSASFGQTIGIKHSFDTYGVNFLYRPVIWLYLKMGYRHDYNAFYDNTNGPMIGVMAAIPITKYADIILDNYVTDYPNGTLIQAMFGFKMKIAGGKTENRFF